MFSHSRMFLLLALTIGCFQLIAPEQVSARGGGGGGGGHGGGGFGGGGFGGGGFRGGGFGGGGFGGGYGGYRSGGFGGYEGNWGSGYRGGFTGRSMGNFGSGNVGSFSRGATVSRAPVSPGWRGNNMQGNRFNRFRQGEFGGFGGWGYWLGAGYWGFYSPWWFGGFPFWYSYMGYGNYSNPYYNMNPADYGNYDYGVPIQQASSEQTTEEDPSFTAAREAFYAGNYQLALTDITQAMVNQPQNQDIHEFHALTLFALGQYDRAAAVAYDVLNAGPGWDWTILQSFYPSVDVYTQQLRGLEHYVSDHNRDAGPRFLLAYQYLMQGHWDAADRQLTEVTELQPRDTLSKNLLAGLNRVMGKGTSSAPAATAANAASSSTSASSKGVNSQAIVGNWMSRPTPDVTINFTLKPDQTFTWTVTQNGQQHAFAGNYTLQGDDLVLTRQDGQKMEGTLNMPESGAFNFRLKNTSPNDPGLEFTK